MAQQVSRINSDQYVAAYNLSGSSIPALRCVKISGHLFGKPGIVLADAGDDIFGVTLTSSTNQQKVYVAVAGAVINNVNTSQYIAGTYLYCSSSGSLTTYPQGSFRIKVINADYTSGTLLVDNAPTEDDWVSQKPEYDMDDRVELITFYRSATQTTPNRHSKVEISYTGDQPDQEIWQFYASDGTTVIKTETITYTWTADVLTNAVKAVS
jgi:hypothetical protein